MKTFLTTTIAFCLFAFTCSAQWLPGTGKVYLEHITDSVGIGTASPAGKLQVVNGGWDLLTATYSFDLGAKGITGGWARAFRIVNSSGSNGTDGGAFGVMGSGTTPNYVFMAIPTTHPVGYTSTKIIALDNSGNIGIGLTTPTLKTHIIGPLGLPANTGSAQTGLLRLQGSGNNAVLDFSVGGTSGAALQVTSQTDLSQTYSLILNPNGGKVGIGTKHPDQALTVNGQVHSTSVLVETTVPADYVFNTDYNLRPLADVKAYVDKNHHLPEVPSAAEFKKDGQNLGEMNMLLLKKVEELTLYLINEHKANETLQAQVSELKSQMKLLTKTKR